MEELCANALLLNCANRRGEGRHFFDTRQL
jgi:hypothetical protein